MKNKFEKRSFNTPGWLILFLTTIFLVEPNFTFSQIKEGENKTTTSPTLHHEVKEDNYIPVSRESQGRTPAYNYSMTNIFTEQVNVDANGQNIVGDAANEPSIAVDKNNPNKMVIGWRQFDTISSNFRQAGWAFTTDGGHTWTFPGVIEPGIFRSDPVLDADRDGNFYYNSLTVDSDFFCNVFKSTDGGANWDNGVFAQGGDKQWMTIDKTNSSGAGHIYAFWTSSFSICYPDFFTRSTDNGVSFEDCTSIPNDPYWGTLTVDSDGNLYIGASIGFDFMVGKSTNAKDSNQVVSWDMATVVNLNGSITFGGGPNPGGLLGQTNIAVDTSGGPYNGNVYLLCSVDRSSNNDPADVMFARSTDGGLSFSSPIRINDDAGTSAYQWFGTMSVAPNGRIDVIWLDTRDNPGTYLSALYYSNSTDGGVTWSPNERLSDFFDPHLGWPQQDKMGDYFDMVSDIYGARLAWAATFNGEQDVYFSYISDSTIVPVELTSFSASIAKNAVTLNWSTATELNNYGFEVQRSTDGAEFYTVGFVNGNGTTVEQHNYSYSDKNLVNGKYYYRLKQVDYNGSYEYSNVVEIDYRAFESYLLEQNYPNPFNPSTTIGFGIQDKSNVKITIINSIGEEVAVLLNEEKEPGYYQVEFNASNLPSGVYFYQLRAGTFTETKKMILAK